MPPNRTDRPISSSSDPISTEEKKRREVNQITSESETEDEVLTALTMAADLGKTKLFHWYVQFLCSNKEKKI